jgi:coenzyme F420-reducing hydrogenase delta subunit/NAD-dependent dihydropyrimidine dehydrogenase PreA subunit
MPDVVAVKQNEDFCSSCSICSTLCPYDALKKHPETGKIFLEIEKCQVCGLCYSTCPAKAIDTYYYDVNSLTSYLEKAKKKYASDTLVIMCRGSAPDFAQVGEMFGVKKFVPLSVPCVGRIPEEVLLKAIIMGMSKIYALACDEDYCRFQRGSAVTVRKVLALNLLLEQLGYGPEVITLKQNSLKVKVNSDLCIACANCVFYCPYHAAKLEGQGVVSFDLTLCRGCGLCVAMCPALALDLENWEKDRISALVSKVAPKVKQPRIMVFRCQWAAFPSLDGNGNGPNIGVIDLPCASRVDIAHILQAFQNGADGVLVAACAEDDCKQEKASGKAKHSVEKLKERLGQIGLQDRLHFCTVSPRYPEQFHKELEQFGQAIKGIAPKEGAK